MLRRFNDRGSRGPIHSPIIGAGMTQISCKFIYTNSNQTLRREMLHIPLWPDLFSLFSITGLRVVRYHVCIVHLSHHCTLVKASSVSSSSNPPTLPDQGPPGNLSSSQASVPHSGGGVGHSLGGVHDVPSSTQLVVKTVSGRPTLLRFPQSLASVGIG